MASKPSNFESPLGDIVLCYNVGSATKELSSRAKPLARLAAVSKIKLHP